MNEEKKQCIQCKHFLLFEDFKTNQRTGQLTKMCIKCLEKEKLSKERLKCQHERRKSTCKLCRGSQICEHERRKAVCKICKGSQICEHERQRSQCLVCGGGSICQHHRKRAVCKTCNGGSICEHEKVRNFCKTCRGSQICEHSKQKNRCPICDPAGHLASVVSNRVRGALKKNKEMSSKQYLGCDIDTFKQHIESQFTEGMSWKNYGSEWHIDHKIPLNPLKYQQDGQPPTLEEVAERLHYLNTQPMWASENIAKGNRFVSE